MNAISGDANPEASSSDAESNTGNRILSFVQRAERLNEDIKDLNADKSAVFAEAKGQGFDVPTIKKIIKLRQKDPDDRAEEDALLDTYMHAIGMSPSRTRT